MPIFEGEDYEIGVTLFWDGCAGDRLVLICLQKKLFTAFLSLLAENARGKVAIANDSSISVVASFWFGRSPWERSTQRSSVIPPSSSGWSWSLPLSRLWFPLSLLAFPVRVLLHETQAGDNDALYLLLFQVVSLTFCVTFPGSSKLFNPCFLVMAAGQIKQRCSLTSCTSCKSLSWVFLLTESLDYFIEKSGWPLVENLHSKLGTLTKRSSWTIMLGLPFLFEINIKILICYWLFLKCIKLRSILLRWLVSPFKKNQNKTPKKPWMVGFEQKYFLFNRSGYITEALAYSKPLYSWSA